MCQVAFEILNLDNFPLPETEIDHHLMIVRPARRTASKFGPVDRVYIIDGSSVGTLNMAYGFDLVPSGQQHLGCPVYRVVMTSESPQFHSSQVLQVVPV